MFDRLRSLTTHAASALALCSLLVSCSDSSPAPSVATSSQKLQASRSTDGLLLLYTFDEGAGDTVLDRSGAVAAYHLSVDETATTWLPGALRLDSPTALTTAAAADPAVQAIGASGELTVELWVTTADITQNGPARIATMSVSPYLRNFTLGQGVWSSSGDRIEVRLRSTSTSDNGTPAIQTGVGSFATGLHQVVFTRRADGLARVYIDGSVVQESTVSGDLTNWSSGMPLILGNEADGSRPWLGTYHLAAAYDRALTETEVATHYALGAEPDVSGDVEIGAACTQDADCGAPTLGALCNVELPGGYCTVPCTSDAECPGGHSCHDGSYCVVDCLAGDTCERPEHVCAALTPPGGDPFCRPTCAQGCPAGSQCDAASDRCMTCGSTDAVCDGLDDDCDGEVDEDYVVTSTACGLGSCASVGELTCQGGVEVDSCAPGAPAPDDVSCDGIDDDCDGEADEDYGSSSTVCGQGACLAGGSLTCQNGALVDSCVAGSPAPDDASCDGIDDDCDGLVDEEFASVPTTCGEGDCQGTGDTLCLAGQLVDTCEPNTEGECAGTGRIPLAPLALYTFDEGAGDMVYDVSGSGTPLDLVVTEPASATWSGGGLQLTASNSIRSSSAATKIHTGVQATQSLTVEAWVSLDDASQNGPARIVTVSSDPYSRNFTMGQGAYGQSGDRVDVRLRTTATDDNGTPSLTSAGGTLTAGQHHLVYTRDAAGAAAIYIDGSEVASGLVGGDPGNWDESMPLGLGSELDGTRSWLGTYYLVALYDAALTAAEVQQNYDAGPKPDAPPSTTLVGVSCSVDGDCAGLAGGFCDTELPGGYCTVSCTSDAECPGGHSCHYGSYCVVDCLAGDTCERPEHVCAALTPPGGDPFCRPTCAEGCPSGFQCDVANDRCVTCASSDAVCDGVDDDCDGEVDEDYVVTTTACGLGGCASTGELTCQGGVEVDSCAPGSPAPDDASCDGVDDDCDGEADEDYASSSTVCGEGACTAGGSLTCQNGALVDSCVAGSPAPDDASCNGVDDDCDGVVDEDYTSVATSCGVGACAASGTLTCQGGVEVDSCSAGTPGADDASCDGVDDDCDGVVDEDYTSVATSCGAGACAASGTLTCQSGSEVDSCNAGTPAANDSTCDGVDDDCDGQVDEDFVSEATSCGVGACASSGSTSCQDGVVLDSCSAGTPAVSDATCDGVDDDCDGSMDEDFVESTTSCGSGLCQATGTLTCAGGSLVDSCVIPAGASCEDGDVCNGQETCSSQGVCEAGTPIDVDDGDACTDDLCDPQTGQVTHPIAVGAPCDDGNDCTAGEVCDATGECGDGQEYAYEDGDPCTVHTCDPVAGVKVTYCDPVDNSAPSTPAERNAWLYEGDDPLQTGVAPGTIKRAQATLVRGHVMDGAGVALGGVRVTVLGHPELGETQSQLNGDYELVVNGGGPLTIRLEHPELLPAERTVDAKWASSTRAPDAVLLPVSNIVTAIDTAETQDYQVAMGEVVSDADGTRQAAAFFPPSTQAVATLPNGSTQPLTMPEVRITEYTVGSMGEAAMPAPLPPGVAYTYAAEFSVDEAMDMDADGVEFSQPVPIYVDNFLGFSVGGIVPSADWDPKRARWVPAPNGRVIEILDVSSGLADLDTDGDGAPDDAATLSDLGITTGERETLALTYPIGHTLWRVPVTHFSTKDFNWPGNPPPDTPPPPPEPPPDNDCTGVGSIIRCETQVLGESVPVAGTPFSLHYESDRVPGRSVPIRVQLTGDPMPSGLQRVDLEVTVAGQVIEQSFSPSPNLLTTVEWDRLDAFGRPVAGAVNAQVRIGYVYRLRYRVPRDIPGTWGWFSNVAIEEGLTRSEQIVWSDYTVSLGGWDQRGVGLGGFSLTPHHTYDPVTRVVYYGDGSRLTTIGMPAAVRPYAGDGGAGSSGDGGPARLAMIGEPTGVAAGPDGSTYIADAQSNTIRKVAPDGTIATLSVDGGSPAPNLLLNADFEDPLGSEWDSVGSTWGRRSGINPEPFDGEYFLRPPSVSNAEVRQDVDVSAYAQAIDAEAQAFEFEGFVRSFNQSPPDESRVIIEFLDVNAGVLAALDSGYYESRYAWRRVDLEGRAPVGTRVVRVRLLARRSVGSNNDGYFDGLSLRPVAAYPNRLINGGAELPPDGADDLPGWTAIGADWDAKNAGTTPAEGNYFFQADPSAQAELQQEVDVSAEATAIDAGERRARFSGLVRSYPQNPTDAARIVVEYLDGGGTVLEAFDSGEIRQSSAWLPVDDIRLVPSGTRSILVRLIATRYNGTNNDGYFDALELSLEALSPVSAGPLNRPQGLAVGPENELYIADSYNHRVVRIDGDGSSRVVAGNGEYGSDGDGGPAVEASLSLPTDVAVAEDGALYIADYGSHQVRRVAPDGTIHTFAGTGLAGYSGDDIDATAAQLYGPHGVAVDEDGLVYIADRLNHRIRQVAADGLIRTVAGNGNFPYAGHGVPATTAQLEWPTSVAVDGDGGLLIADSARRVRRVLGGTITDFAGTGAQGDAGDGGPALLAEFEGLSQLAVVPNGDVLIADQEAHRVRRLTPAMPGLGVDDVLIPRGDMVDIFDARGRHVQTLHSLTGAVMYDFTYDGAGRLLEIVDFDGNTTTVERDSGGNPTAIVGPYGQRTTVDVNGEGWLTYVTDPLGQTSTFGYGADGLLEHMRDTGGYDHFYSYSPEGRLQRDDNPHGGFVELDRVDVSEDAHVVTKSTALGRATQYEVTDPSGGDYSKTVTLPSGLTNTKSFVGDGVTSVSLANGMQSESRVVPDPRFGLVKPTYEKTTITPSGLQRVETSSRSAVMSDPDNPLSLLSETEIRTQNGRVWTTTYDAMTRTFTSTSPAGRQSSYTIDEAGRVVSTQPAGRLPVSFVYDARGRLDSIVEGSRQTSFDYASAGVDAGYLAMSSDALLQETFYERDALGRPLVQTLPDGSELDFGWDGLGNMSSLFPPGQPEHAQTFGPMSLQSSYAPPALAEVPAPETTYGYDLDRALTQMTLPDGRVQSITYDSAGRRDLVTTAEGTYDYDYYGGTVCTGCAPGRLSRVTSPSGVVLDFAYDGQLTTAETWSGAATGAVQYGYDADFRVSTETVVAGGQSYTTHFGYDPDSLLSCASPTGCAPAGSDALQATWDPAAPRVTDVALGGSYEGRTYNAYGELAAVWGEHDAALLYSEELDSVSAPRDDLGRVVTRLEELPSGSHSWDYTYDAQGRVEQVLRDGTPYESFTYDGNGNRLSRTTSSETWSAQYDAQDRLLSYGPYTYTYGANGDLQTKTDTRNGEVTRYSYDMRGNLLSVELPDGTLVEYSTDGRDRRVAKTVDGVVVRQWLYHDQLNPVAELDGSGNLLSRFVYATRSHVPDYIERGGETYRVFSDHLGSPRVIVNALTGAVVQEMEHDAFGNVLLDTNPGFQPFGFAGGMYDVDTGLVRFGYRDYDSETGRWTAKDPLVFGGGQANLYAYVDNDSVNRRDPSGLFPALLPAICLAGGCEAGAAAGAAALTASAAAIGLGIGWCIDQFTDEDEDDHEDEDDDAKRQCILLYERCIQQAWDGPCGSCLHKCVTQKEWPFEECHPHMRWR